MNQSEQERFLNEFKEKKIIVVCRGIAQGDIVDVAEALYEGGIRFMEVPFDQKNTSTNIATMEKIRAVSEAMKGKMHVGAGTTCTSAQLQMAREAGAEIIIAPNMDEEIIAETKSCGLISMPGCMTPSEMMKAHKMGADLIKLFPSSVLTQKAVQEIAVPMNHLSLVCFGGVTADNLMEVLSLGVAGVGAGSGILNKEALENKDYKKITELARAYTKQIIAEYA